MIFTRKEREAIRDAVLFAQVKGFLPTGESEASFWDGIRRKLQSWDLRHVNAEANAAIARARARNASRINKRLANTGKTAKTPPPK